MVAQHAKMAAHKNPFMLILRIQISPDYSCLISGQDGGVYMQHAKMAAHK